MTETDDSSASGASDLRPLQTGDYCECCDPDVLWCANRTPARTDYA